MATTHLNLIRLVFKKNDGTGDTIEVPYSMAAGATVSDAHATDSAFKYRLWLAYQSLKDSGKLAKIDPPVKGANEEERMLNLFSRYSFYEVQLDDDGNVVDDTGDDTEDGGANPTTKPTLVR